MRLGEKQELFAELFAQHIVWLYEQGYKVRIGDVWAREGHIANSNHYIKLAGDINLFKDGEYLTKTEQHKESGDKWESRHELCRWGGRFNDGNHYSLIHHGRM
jgi:hypothetical protein